MRSTLCWTKCWVRLNRWSNIVESVLNQVSFHIDSSFPLFSKMLNGVEAVWTLPFNNCRTTRMLTSGRKSQVVQHCWKRVESSFIPHRFKFSFVLENVEWCWSRLKHFRSTIVEHTHAYIRPQKSGGPTLLKACWIKFHSTSIQVFLCSRKCWMVLKPFEHFRSTIVEHTHAYIRPQKSIWRLSFA